MPVRQIQVANDSVEDRLILRIGTSNNEEIRVFFTRRFLRDLWPHMAAMLTGHLAATHFAPNDDSTEESFAEVASFDLAFQDDNPSFPLGANPLLAIEAILEANGDGAASLTLREARERSFKLSLNAELLQALCSMLRAANEHAEWDLPLEYTLPVSIANAPANSLLH